MGLGIVASCAAIPKFLALRTLRTSNDFAWVTAPVDMWSFLEMCLGIIAACVPALRSLLESSMRKLGVLTPQRPRIARLPDARLEASLVDGSCAYKSTTSTATSQSTSYDVLTKKN
jgi:hypothetical protein